ncbi:class I histocompatibility antigen, F10 alpha chain-like isoform X2 [Brienomyrus brachyistius]|nr:class I histocompatibility antigen, F10 alpha chain-like isoform X2 [Brienomyrus brachyistius]XP_048850426.1 class I histocompatibility antigen, F10 alpha chain-like isoform X2 [Brienomyrus brachyistius]
MRSRVPLPDWLKNHDEKQHWEDINTIAILNQNNMAKAMEVVSQHINQTGESPLKIHSYQGYGRCDLHPDGQSQGFLTHAYNGRDFLTFDVNNKAWIAVMPEAAVYKREREKSPILVERIANFYQYDCAERLKVFQKYAPVLQSKKKPTAFLYERKDSDFFKVTCHVTGFYPWEVQVEWRKDGWLPLVEGVTSGEVLPNGDGTLQLKKTLTISRGNQGCVTTQSYTCLVQHSSLSGNITMTWAPNRDCTAAITVGGLSLILILILIVWKYRSKLQQCGSPSGLPNTGSFVLVTQRRGSQ